MTHIIHSLSKSFRNKKVISAQKSGLLASPADRHRLAFRHGQHCVSWGFQVRLESRRERSGRWKCFPLRKIVTCE